MKGISNGTYAVNYKNMKGVNFSKSGDKNHFSYMENMYRDYDGDHSDRIESIPGFRKIVSLGNQINGIFVQRADGDKEYILVHSGTALYRFRSDRRDSVSSLTQIAELNDVKSSSFQIGRYAYVHDGYHIVRVDENGGAADVDPNTETVYVPTAYVNETPFEQLNLLTPNFYEKYLISASETVSYGTDGLIYAITSEEQSLCAVVGGVETLRGEISIPAYKTIANKKYKVDEISDNAFLGNNTILGVKISKGIYRIGKYAFSGCSKLRSVKCQPNLAIIDSNAFSDCPMLQVIYIGSGIVRFGNDVFRGTDLISIKYSSDKEDFLNAENSDALADLISPFTYDRSMVCEIPIHTPTSNILSVTLGGVSLEDYSLSYRENGDVRSIVFPTLDSHSIEGKEVEILAVANFNTYDGESALSFLGSRNYTSEGFYAIAECKISESFDGRIFMSANPNLPGAVFYSTYSAKAGDGLLYFGVYDYFCDGVGMSRVTSLLSSSDALIVFKSSDDGGSIFYHTPTATGNDFIPRIYPVTYRHSGIGCIGESISFFDDPIFISATGVSAIDKKRIDLDRSIVCRSHNVNSRLLSENLSNASLAVWCGYLALGVNGHIYLADSRELCVTAGGVYEYEWYYLCDIGTYENDTRVYRYASIAPEGYNVFKMPDTVTEMEVMSELFGGRLVNYVLIDGKKYVVYPTEEMQGGVFHPMTVLMGTHDGLLYFGTDNGDLCVFNNDKRSTPPDTITDREGTEYKNYLKSMGRSIHPQYYSFGTHRYRSSVKTASDNGSLPGLTKDTVKHSTVLKCSIAGGGKLRFEVKTDRTNYTEYVSVPNSAPDFSNFSFDCLSLSPEEDVNIPISEKEKNWIEKELCIYCDDFRSPISLESVSYRYKIKGRIKHS